MEQAAVVQNSQKTNDSNRLARTWARTPRQKKSKLQVGLKKIRKDFGLKSACSNLCAGLSLEAEVGSFSPRLSHAAAIVAPVLQL